MTQMNLIVICADTFRRDYLGCYDAKHVETPHLDEFAKVSTRFDNAYGEALPTIEARKVYFTGRSLLPYAPPSGLKDLGPQHRGWEPMDNYLVSMSEALKGQGYRSAFITDCLHYQKPNMNYHRAFDYWEFIRGQENDRWASAPAGAVTPRDHIQPHYYGARYERTMGQYIANTRHWRGEEDTFCAQVARRAARCVEDLASLGQPLFLWVDMFDPHEPWDPPKAYLDRYWSGPIPTPGRYLFGYGCDVAKARAEDMPLIKACYAAEVTLTDRWIGHLLETIRRCGLYENTVIVFTSDHGTSLFEHGFVQKEPYGLYGVMTGLPLLIHHPDPIYHGKTVEGLVSAVDFYPSLLSLLDVEPPAEQCSGVDFTPLMKGATAEVRECCVSSWHPFGAVRDHHWNYMFPVEEVPRRAKNKKERAIEEERFSERLFDLRSDPCELVNVLDRQPDAQKMMRHRAQKVWRSLPGG